MKKDYDRVAKALDEKLATYLEKSDITSLDTKLTDTKLRFLLLIFTKDFTESKLSFDDYSSLCEKLLGVLQNKKDGTDSDLFMICHYGAELSWYIRNEPVRAGNFLQKVLDYCNIFNSNVNVMI